MEPIRLEDLHAVAQHPYWLKSDELNKPPNLSKKPHSMKHIQHEFDKLLETYSVTRTIPLNILQKKFEVILEQNPRGISLDLRGAVIEGECFEIQSFQLPDGLTLSNGTLEVVQGMHIQSSQGIQLIDIGIIGAESGVRMLDSTVNMERCSIASSGTLLLVENSNSKLVDCRMCDSRSGDGLVATGKFSYVAAKGCQFLENFGCCVYMFDGAGGAFEGCTFKGAKEYVGMALKDVGTRVSAVDCDFSDNARNGMAVGGGACASLDQCTLQNTRKFHGLAVSDPGSKVMASDCKFQDNEQCGVFVANQASITLERCFSKRARRFSGVAIKDKWSTLLATGCEFAENQHSGVAAGGGSSVTLNSCVLKGAKDFYGLGVTGDGTEVVSRDCQFLDNHRCFWHINKSQLKAFMIGKCKDGEDVDSGKSSRCGVYIYSGGKATLEKCISKGATEFDGLAVFGRGSVTSASSELIAEGCLFVDNKRNGVTVGGGATAKLIECISRRSDTVSTSSGRGLSVIGKKSGVSVHRCNFGDTANEKQKFYRVLGCFSR